MPYGTLAAPKTGAGAALMTVRPDRIGMCPSFIIEASILSCAGK